MSSAGPVQLQVMLWTLELLHYISVFVVIYAAWTEEASLEGSCQEIDENDNCGFLRWLHLQSRISF